MRKLLLIIFFSSTVLAQDNLLSLNLEEAIEYGIENNRNLKNAEREIQTVSYTHLTLPTNREV